MTLLSRGIRSGGQGRPGFIDVAIAKAEGEKAQKEATLDAFSTQLEGLKSGGTYLGETSRTILAEFGNAFETAMDAYAADPSKENKDRLNQIKTQAKDFQHMAVAARQNSLNQYNAVRQNPDAYGFSAEQALEQFNELENASINARFDMDTMQMFFGDQETGEQFLGNAAYYNGQQPLYFAKKPDISDVEVPGTWGVGNFEKLGYLLNQEGGEEKILDAFKQTARFSNSAWRDTSVLNYLIEEKGISEDDPNLAQRIQETRNNPEELIKAIDYEANKELEAMKSHKVSKESAAARESFNKTFRGDRMSRGKAPRLLAMLEKSDANALQNVDDLYIDEFSGVSGVRMLNTPITDETGKGGMAGLSEYGDVINGLDVDALGRIVIQVDKVVPDPKDEEKEIVVQDFHVLKDGQLYDNLRSKLLKEGTFLPMKMESQARMEAYEDEFKRKRLGNAYANTENVETPDRFKITTTADDVKEATGLKEEGPNLEEMRREQKEAEIEKLKQEQGNALSAILSPNRTGLSRDVIGDRTVGSSALNEAFIDRLIEEGYTVPEIRSGIDQMKKDRVTVVTNPLRHFVQHFRLPTFGRFAGFGSVKPIQKAPGGQRDDMQKAVDAFEQSLIKSNPGYEAKYMTGPVDKSEEMLGKAKSEQLFGRDFSKNSPEVETIFGEEGYSGDGTLINVPDTSKSGVTIGGLDLGKDAGNIEEKLEILSEFIPEEEMKTLESMQGLTGQQAEQALNDSLETGKLNPDSWGFDDDTFKEIQGKFLGRNTMPAITRKMSKFGVTEEQIQQLPPEVRSAIVSMEFVTPGKRGLSLIAKAMKSGKKEDWLAAADEYESYYGNEEQVSKKLKSKRILPGNLARAKKAAELIRSVYS